MVSYLGILLGLLLLGFGLMLVRSRLALGSADALRTAALPSLGWGLVACIGQFLLVIFLVIAAFSSRCWPGRLAAHSGLPRSSCPCSS